MEVWEFGASASAGRSRAMRMVAAGHEDAERGRVGIGALAEEDQKLKKAPLGGGSGLVQEEQEGRRQRHMSACSV